MASETLPGLLGAAGLWADPWFWAGAAAAFSGLAAGQAVRIVLPGREDGAKTLRRKPRRISRALAFLSLGILALAGFLVLADRNSLSGVGLAEGTGLPWLLIWALLLALLCTLAGLRWLAAGLPLAALCLGALWLLRLALQGWLPLPPGSGVRVASFLPYELGPKGVRGHLELVSGGSALPSQELALGSASIALSVETLDLAGPLGFLAELSSGTAPVPAAGVSTFYRLVGIAAPGAEPQSFATPVHLDLVDAVLALPEGEGRAPGASVSSKPALFGLALRSRRTSQALGLVALEPLSFTLGRAGILSSSSP
jgi:hypothetical protein